MLRDGGGWAQCIRIEESMVHEEGVHDACREELNSPTSARDSIGSSKLVAINRSIGGIEFHKLQS